MSSGSRVGALPRSALWMLGIALVTAVATVLVGAWGEPNPLAASLLQGITVVLGVAGSVAIGRDQSLASAREEIRLPAASAFRRVRNLYKALGRQRDAIDALEIRIAEQIETATQFVHIAHVQSALAHLSDMVTEQIETSADSLEDWRDLVPGEVKRIEDEARKKDAR